MDVNEYHERTPLSVIRPVDAAFLREINDRLNTHLGVPIKMNQAKVLKVVQDVLRYSYMWYQSMTISTRRVVIPKATLKAGWTGGDYVVKLPNSVYGICDIKQANTSYGGFGLSNRLLGIPLLGAIAASTDNLTVDSTLYNDYRVSDATVAVFEVATYREVFKMGNPFDFIVGTSEFIFRGSLKGDIVLDVFVKNDPSVLYNDYYFIEHVTGECLKRGARALGTFDLKLAGDSNVDWKEMKSDGEDMVKECKDAYKSFMNTPRTFWKS